MTKAFHALTDDELAGIFGSGPISREDLLARYRELRDHHVAETEALTRRDRSAILRMAGNIACGILANELGSKLDNVPKMSVAIAREIMAEADR